jgi:hypothetical protein
MAPDLSKSNIRIKDGNVFPQPGSAKIAKKLLALM